jgi:hypothetical protein
MTETQLGTGCHADVAWLRDDQLRYEFVGFLAEMQAGRRLLRRVLGESESPDASASEAGIF